MASYIIHGGLPLNGEISVRGFKNAATPILAATLLIKGKSVLRNVPRIIDVEHMVSLLQILGCDIGWSATHEITVDASHARIASLDDQLVKSMRSSILLVGPMLARFQEALISEPGGCNLGNRPLTTHLKVLQDLGAIVKVSRSGNLHIQAHTLQPNTIILPEFSVTATENAILASVLLDGNTTIRIAACEPHVQDLIGFLNSAGARIEILPGHQIHIKGVKKLHPVSYPIIPDPIESGTFAIVAAVAGKEVTIRGLRPDHLDLPLLKLGQAGVRYTMKKRKNQEFDLTIYGKKKYSAFDVQALPYPGFPSDLQAPFTILATQANGDSMFHDPLYEDRLKHIPDLLEMGAKVRMCDPHRMIVSGPTPLFAQKIKSFNIRAGATMLIAGLIADGATVIQDIEQIERGYEQLPTRLNQIGAKIERVES